MEGTPFGRYRLVELLGRGGMGEVWRAFDTSIDRVVALKMLPANFADDQVFQERFRREARAAAGLDEPHVVPIHDFGEIEGRLYVTMRLIKGRDLQDVLADGPLPPPRAVGIIEQIASALHAAHQVGLIHRDVKPSNILVTDEDFAYLIDFGIARAAGEIGLTSTGATIGTWAYMAPERFQKGKADARADIYALACVLYQSLTGQVPFPGVSLEQIAVAHMMQPPPRPSALSPAVAPAMDDVVATGMAKEPDQRYPTTKDFAQAARDAVTTPITRPEPTPTTETTRAAETKPAPPVATEPASESTTPPTVRRDVGMRLPGGVSASAVAQPRPPADAALPTVRPITARLWWRRKGVTIPVAALLTIIAVAAAIATITVITRSDGHIPTRTVYGAQFALPFTGLKEPSGLAVDTAGTLYITDTQNNRVVALAAGSTTQSVLPFTGLKAPAGVAVDRAGTLYVVDAGNDRVVTLTANSTIQTVLPFAGLKLPVDVAVDGAGTLYVADFGNRRVVMLAAGSTTQSVLPFTGLNRPGGVAVDNVGTVYVTDSSNNWVASLAARSTTQSMLPFTGLNGPNAVAVDDVGTVYVSDGHNHRVVMLAAGSTTQSVLPFTGLTQPTGVAVDTAGNVYVMDHYSHRVVKLPAS